MSKEFLNYIGGKYTKSLSGKTFSNINPAQKDEILGIFPRSTKEDVGMAVKAAKEAFKEWSEVPPPARARILFKAGEIMAAKKEELAKVIVGEMGKTVKEALGEVQGSIDTAYFMAGEGRRLFGKTTHSALSNRLAMTRRVPIGVCAIITPFNGPIAGVAGKTFPALICGNAVVIKPAEDTPQTANNFIEILNEAGLPPGVCNLIHGYGEEAGEALIRNPDIKLASFTGSTEVGTHINQVCSERLIRVSLEMGGKNGLLVLEDADIDRVINVIISGAFSMAGQRCASTSRLILQAEIYDKVIEKLAKAVKQLKVGPGDDESTQVCPIINEKQLNRIAGYVKIGKEEGAKIIIGGKILKGGIYSKGFYFVPTIFTGVQPKMRIAQEEIFGPVLAVMKCNSFEEGIDILNSTSYGLTSSVWTKDVNRALLALDRIKTGVCYVNAATFGSEIHLPFGGFGLSGNGYREDGNSIDVFSEWKTLYVDYSGGSR